MAQKVIQRSRKPLVFQGSLLKGSRAFALGDTLLLDGIDKSNPFGVSLTDPSANKYTGTIEGKGNPMNVGSVGSAASALGYGIQGIIDASTKKRSLRDTIGYATGGALSGMTDAASSAAGIFGNAVNQAKIANTSDARKTMGQYAMGNVDAANNEDLLNTWNMNNTFNHVTSRDLRNKSFGSDLFNAVGAAGQGAAAGAQVGGPIGGAIGGVIGGVSSVIGSLFGHHKAKKEARHLNDYIDWANQERLVSLNNAAENVDTQNDSNMLANYSAFGGYLGNGDIYAGGGSIDINPANRGKFTATKKRTGKSTEELTHSKNPLTRKRAIFAQNAAGWNHACGGKLLALGGPLDSYGGDFSNGLTEFNAGGTHEENPAGGIQQGIAANGQPNLVEQGEIKWKDYIFSDRLWATKELLKKSGLPVKYDHNTFASIAEKLGKDSEERPEDPITTDTLNAMLSRLQNAQEALKSTNEEAEKARNTINMIKAGMSPENAVAATQNEAQQDDQQQPQEDNPEQQQETPQNQFAMGSKLTHRKTATKIPTLDEALAETPDTNISGMFGRNDLKGLGYLNSAYSRMSKNKPGIAYQNPDNNYIAPVNNRKVTDANLGLADLRYSPIIGNVLSVLGDITGRTNKANHSYGQEITDMTSRLGRSSYIPITQTMQYTPVDRNYWFNRLSQQTNAARRSLSDLSNANASQKAAQEVALDYNAGNQMGDAAFKGDEENYNRLLQAQTFNRGTAQANQAADMQRQQLDNAINDMRFRGILAAAQSDQESDLASSKARSQNLSNLFNSLGDVGREEFQRNMINSNPALYYGIDRLGNQSYKTPDMSGIMDSYNALKRKQAAYGGLIDIKKRR